MLKGSLRLICAAPTAVSRVQTSRLISPDSAKMSFNVFSSHGGSKTRTIEVACGGTMRELKYRESGYNHFLTGCPTAVFFGLAQYGSADLLQTAENAKKAKKIVSHSG